MGIVVAIDGPAGAGKSTVSRMVAERLGFFLVDTGAIYRTAALVSARQDLHQEEALAAALVGLDLRFTEGSVFLGEEDVSLAIRTPQISQHASVVSVMPKVRAALLELQRKAARQHPKGAVVEGRDIGTVVFPDAEAKIFLTASVDERARRRKEELLQRGIDEPIEKVRAEIVERDDRDTNRPVAPLKPAPDAKIVDTTGRPVAAVVTEIVAHAMRGV
ncbi:MAG: (d)CMP kinase [Myxococcota bacterium]